METAVRPELKRAATQDIRVWLKTAGICGRGYIEGQVLGVRFRATVGEAKRELDRRGEAQTPYRAPSWESYAYKGWSLQGGDVLDLTEGTTCWRCGAEIERERDRIIEEREVRGPLVDAHRRCRTLDRRPS